MSDQGLHEHRFHTGVVELNYAEGPPHGVPFVVLHGGSGSWRSGETFLELLTPHWHVYAPDLRGHGESGHVPGQYLLRDYVVDIAALLEGAVRKPAIVFGHSLGGEVGVMLAAQHPRFVRALIVGDAPLTIESHVTEEPLHRAQNELWHSLCGKAPEEIIPQLEAMLTPGPDGPQHAVDSFGKGHPWFAFQAWNLHRLDPDMLAAVLEGPEYILAGYDPERLLPPIQCPVLLLQADPDAGGGMRNDEVALGLRLLRHGTHVRLHGIGHELHGPSLQAPKVLEAITPFLQGL